MPHFTKERTIFLGHVAVEKGEDSLLGHIISCHVMLYLHIFHLFQGYSNPLQIIGTLW